MTQQVSTIKDLRAALATARQQHASIGFVPTMGYLHAGHASLMKRASTENQTTVASVFANPLQFAPEEDLATYPRDIEKDLAIARQEGIDYLFVPDVEEMYPQMDTGTNYLQHVLTSVTVNKISSFWEGQHRPSHFKGVTTVVAKLFNIVGPCTAYFGEKDFQQLALIKQLIRDLSYDVSVVGCPIVREPDGLALSSRNIYLNTEAREAALVLKAALDAGKTAIEKGATDPGVVSKTMHAVLADEPLATPDYVAVVCPDSLQTPKTITSEVRLMTAVRFGATRLIDNCAAQPKPQR